MKNIVVVLLIIAVVLIVGFTWYKNGYDAAVRLHEQVSSQWAQVENQLQRRNDLIANLVNTVKGFAAQEKNIFIEVTRLRSQWGQAQTISDKIDNANQLSGALSRLLLVAENYPQLKSNENFLALQAQLEGTENRIAVERMRYNEAAQVFNAFQKSFFGRFFTAQAGVNQPAAYFKAAESAREVPEVKF